jgi:Copper type II ascorbate-dependent monooxygenase, C-terminal domain
MKTVKFLVMAVILATTAFLQSCEKPFDTYETSEIPTDFIPLAKPKADEGYQIRIEPFPIQKNFEREFYVRKELGNTEEVYLNGFEMKARPGTHHLISYAYGKDDKLNPVNVMYDQNMPNNTLAFRSAGTTGGPLFQSPSANYKLNLPAGYAVKLAPNTSFLMNSHYFNKTDKTRFGEIFVNYYTIPKAKVEQILEVEYLSPEVDLILPPNKKTTMVSDFIFEKETVIPSMLSHYHKRGEKFEIRIKNGPRNGELIYESTYYDDPKTLNFTPALVLKKGEGLTSTVTYNNDTNRTIKWGVTSEDEMNIAIIFKYNR